MMKRFLVREIAILLVMALLIPTLSMAEDGGIEVEMADDALGMEELVDVIDMDAVELEESVADEGVSLDLLSDDPLGENVDTFDSDSDSDPEADLQGMDEENATKKYGVPTKLTLGVKETYALKCTKKNLTYKSSSAKVAKVNEEGVVTAQKKGNATITVYSNKKKLTTCKVTVIAAPKKVSLGMKSVNLGVKEKLTLEPKITKNSHTSLTYAVKNSKIATVSKTGVVTGVKVGKTTVTVKTHNGKKATLKVAVMKAPSKVTVEPEKLMLEIGQNQVLTASLPKKTASYKLTWISSNKKVAKVDANGVVTAVGAGMAKITVTTFNKKKAACEVTVNSIIGPDSPAEDVNMVQQLLISLGLLPEGYINGLYDEETRRAVDAFQLWAMTDGGYNDIRLTGTVDVNTLNAMRDCVDKGIVVSDEYKENVIIIPYGQERLESGSLILSGRVRIYIPPTVNFIAEDVFVGAEALTICSPVNSYAQEYAQYHGIKWEDSGDQYAQESMEALLKMIDELEQHVQEEEYEPMDLEHMSTEGITDNGLLAQINEFNALQDDLRQVESDINQNIASINDALRETEEALNSFSVSTTDDVLSLSAGGQTFSIYMENMDLLGKDCTVISVKTTKAEDSLLIEVESGGRRLWIRMEENGLKVLDQSQANAIRNTYIMKATRKAVARTNSVASFLWDTVSGAVFNLDNALSTVGVFLTEWLQNAKIAYDAAGKGLPMGQAFIEMAHMNSQDQDLVDTCMNGYWKSFKNLKVARIALETAQKVNKVWFACSFVASIKDLKENINDYNELMEIQGHKHPTKADLEDPEKIDIALSMVAESAIAFTALTVDTVMGVLDVCSQIQTAFSAIQLIAGPVGLGAALASRMTIEAVKFSMNAALKKLAVQLVVSGLSNALCKSIKKKDEKLHVLYGTVSGTVRDSKTNEPLSGVDVICWGYDTVITDAEGKYTLEKVLPGSYEISFVKKGYKKNSTTITVVEDKDTPVDASLEKSTGAIEGIVRDVDTKEPLSGVDVICEDYATTATNANGEYKLENVPVGENQISFAKSGYKTKNPKVTVLEGKTIPYNVYLKSCIGTVVGTVRDANTNEPLSGVEVVCAGCAAVVTDASGQYRIENVPVGDITISFAKSGYKTESPTVNVAEGGVTTWNESLKPSAGTISGTVRDADTNEPLSGVQVVCVGYTTVTTDASGQYKIENVAVGENKISFVKERYTTIEETVTVSENSDVPLSVSMKAIEEEIPIDDEHFPDPVLREIAEWIDSDRNGSLNEYERTWKTINIDSISVEMIGEGYDEEHGYNGSYGNKSLRESIHSLAGIQYFYVKNLNCKGQPIDSYDFSGMETLVSVTCSGNYSSLSVRGCTNLKELNSVKQYYHDKIVNLDFSGCTNLEVLNCYNNGLNGLDLSQYQQLRTLSCGCNNLQNLDVSQCADLTSLECASNQISSLDLSNCAKLELLECLYNKLTRLNVSSCPKLKTLNCERNLLSDLNISGCSALTTLACQNNQLAGLEIGDCGALTTLDCSSNKLTGLIVSSCSGITALNCAGNLLTSLNVSGCPGITELHCSGNQLTSLNVSGCTALTTISCLSNQLTSLDVSGFTKLETLDCAWNQLKNLNAKGCVKLKSLLLTDQKLTSLIVTGCASMEQLDCAYNQLSSLSLAGCTNLETLECAHNQLASLIIDGCSKLATIICVDNKLTSLNMSGYTELIKLDCRANELTSLIVRGCSKLSTLWCTDNRLSQLDVSTCPNLTSFICDKYVDVKR